MTDFSVDFLGCKISQTDAEAIRESLQRAGHVTGTDAASVRVLNTCCVTAEAEKKSRKKVRQLLDGGDDVHVFVTGCGATLNPDMYAGLGARVTALPGDAAAAAGTIVAAADELDALGCKGEASTAAASRRTRAFVKVQDGCSFSCSYCIVPTVRGGTRSRTLHGVLTDVRRRVAMGQREIVLTGINIGLYREPEARLGLPALLTAVADVDGVARVRISSIEVNHVNRRLLLAMAAHPKVCPHLHVPLQSGDDRVLADMRRHYDSRRYLRAIEMVRTLLPAANLTTDVILGYPTEDDAAFEQTMRVAREAGFTKVHAFPFSARPGTDAAALAQVPPQLKRERSRVLRAQAAEYARQHWASRLGSVDAVLVEGSTHAAGDATLTSDDHAPAAAQLPGSRGYTRDYCMTRVTGQHPDGTLVPVVVTGYDQHGLLAEPLAHRSGSKPHA